LSKTQKDLIRKARESLEAAKVLLREGYPGFASARAYYAQFYIAEAFLLGRNLTFSKHSAVISAFARLFVKTGEVEPEYHLFIRQAFNARMTGDYEAVRNITAEEAAMHIQHSEKFVQLAIQMLTVRDAND